MCENNIAKYLKALSREAFEEYCAKNNIDPVGVNAFKFSTESDVGACIGDFLDNEIWLGYILDNKEAMALYLISQVDDAFKRGVELVVSTGTNIDIFHYFRACYRFGMPALDDVSYDTLELLYTSTYNNLASLKDKTYDEDEYSMTVKNAIQISGLKRSKTGKVKNLKLGSTEYESLNSEKSTSIRPVVSAQEAYNFWINSDECAVHFSLKVDGVNVKKMFGEAGDGLKIALSRGRASDSLDYTACVERYLKTRGIDQSKLKDKVTSEAYVPTAYLEEIRKRYEGKEYKTPKSTAMAMLRSPHNFVPVDLDKLRMLAFSYGDLPVNEAFVLLKEAGFIVPPHITVPIGSLPRTSVEEFDTWLHENVFDKLHAKGIEEGIDSDGVVMYLINNSAGDRKDIYSDSNIAIKYSYWEASAYTARVKDIIFEQRRVDMSVVLEIEPTVLKDLTVAKRVGGISSSMVVKDGIRIGDLISFERKSEANNAYTGKRKE